MAPAAVLARKYGYDTVAPDLPGYGLTQVPRGDFKYQLWVDCVSDLIDAELARDGKPVAIFGVSLGGLLSYQAAAQSKKVVGVVGTTMADTREPDVRRGFARTAILGRYGLGALSIAPPLTDWLPMPMNLVSKMDRISNKPELSAICSSDRMGGGNWVPARFLRTFMHHAPAIEPEQFNVCPILIVHPGEDRMTEISHTRRFYERLACPKQMVVLEGASHMPTEQPGVQQMEDAVVKFFGEISKAL
jgi:alpha-beta hydrolase superfamily lysophospholipase